MNIDKERELFEEWYCESNGTTRDNPYNYLKRDENGEYITQQQRMDFKVWMARASIAPEWISVEDELPDELTEVIALCGKSIKFAYLNDGRWIDDDSGETLGYALNNGGYLEQVIDVTHWQPLPQVKGE
jgi:frataxin-like iron-binding protein CyaY